MPQMGEKNQFQCQGAEGFKEMKQITTAIFFLKVRIYKHK